MNFIVRCCLFVLFVVRFALSGLITILVFDMLTEEKWK